MNEPNNGQVPNEPALPQANGQPEAQPANSVIPNVQEYMAEQPATQPAPQQADGQAQGQVNTNTQGTPETDAYKNLQSIYNKTVAEKLAIERQFQMMQQQLQQPQTQPQNQTPQNPYDPNTDWWNALKWEQRQAAKEAAIEASQGTMQNVLKYAQQQTQLQNEVQWQQAHPDADINQVKYFAQQRGISNLDDAYTILTLPQRTNQVITQTAQNMQQQFRQPNNGVSPIRTTSPAPMPTQGLSYEKMAAKFNETNGAVYDSWTPEMQQAFNKETFLREEALRNRR